MKTLPLGKDQINEPCIELDDGTIIITFDILLALIKALKKKGVVTIAEIKEEL